MRAVDGVSFEMKRGETLCIVGESGCGKSVTARSILQILDYPGRVAGGEILFHRVAKRMAQRSKRPSIWPRSAHAGRQIRDVRGKDISMIFQEPMTSLSPIHTIGNQITEAIRLHLPVSKRRPRPAIELLRGSASRRPEERMTPTPSNSAAACASAP